VALLLLSFKSNMDFQELKKQSVKKVLLRGKSGRGKTRGAVVVALEVAEAGGKVLYVDTEAEGSTTMVKVIEDSDTEYTQDTVDNIEYIRADSYSELMAAIHKTDGKQKDFDLIVVDTLDHKHSYVLKHVTDAKRESGADWQEYASIYAEEKEIMEQIGKPRTNFLATVDPDSGSMDKPKGAQTNVHGYFSIVVDMKKDGDDWTHKIRNWVNRDDLINKKVPDLTEALTAEFTETIEDTE